MRTLNYTYKVSLEDGFGSKLIYFNDDYNLKIDEEFQDIFEYKFAKKYNKAYEPLSWYLEKDARQFYKALEHKWMYNEIDAFDLYCLDYDFQDFLVKKYSNKAGNMIEKDVIDYIRKTYRKDLDLVAYSIRGDYIDIDDEVQL